MGFGFIQLEKKNFKRKQTYFSDPQLKTGTNSVHCATNIVDRSTKEPFNIIILTKLKATRTQPQKF